jgi:hypothetical protein
MAHWGTAVLNVGDYQGEEYRQMYQDAMYCMQVRARESIHNPSVGDFQHYVLARDHEARQKARSKEAQDQHAQ